MSLEDSEMKEVFAKYRTFKDLMLGEFTGEELSDIVNNGVDGGFNLLIYDWDMYRLYENYNSEIWKMLEADSKEMGYTSIIEFINTFSGAPNVVSQEQFATMLVWYVAEKIAQENYEDVLDKEAEAEAEAEEEENK